MASTQVCRVGGAQSRMRVWGPRSIRSINAGPKVVDYKLMELALELVCNKTKGDAGQISALGSEAMKKKTPKSL